MNAFEIEPDGAAEHGPCPDCGRQTRSVWGYVSDASGARAVYFARWTDGHIDRGAALLVCIGAWGDGAAPANRQSFGAECRVSDGIPGFMLVDAAELPWAGEKFLGVLLTREAALAHPLKREAFAILDTLVERDARVRELLRD